MVGAPRISPLADPLSFETSFHMRAVTERLVVGLPTTTKSTRLVVGRDLFAVGILEFDGSFDQIWTVLQSLDRSIRHGDLLLLWGDYFDNLLELVEVFFDSAAHPVAHRIGFAWPGGRVVFKLVGHLGGATC